MLYSARLLAGSSTTAAGGASIAGTSRRSFFRWQPGRLHLLQAEENNPHIFVAQQVTSACSSGDWQRNWLICWKTRTTSRVFGSSSTYVSPASLHECFALLRAGPRFHRGVVVGHRVEKSGRSRDRSSHDRRRDIRRSHNRNLATFLPVASRQVAKLAITLTVGALSGPAAGSGVLRVTTTLRIFLLQCQGGSLGHTDFI